MLKLRRIAPAAAAAGLFTGAFTATATAAPAAPALTFAAKIKSVEYGSYLRPISTMHVVLSNPHEWTFTLTPAGDYMIRVLPGGTGSCLTAMGVGRRVAHDVCRPGAADQLWRLVRPNPGLPGPVLIESAGDPHGVLEGHGTDTYVTLAPGTGRADELWDVITAGGH